MSLQKEHNLILPTWADSVYPEPITSMYNMFLISLAFTPEMRRLQAGINLELCALLSVDVISRTHLF